MRYLSEEDRKRRKAEEEAEKMRRKEEAEEKKRRKEEAEEKRTEETRPNDALRRCGRCLNAWKGTGMDGRVRVRTCM